MWNDNINNVADVVALDTVMRAFRSDFNIVMADFYRTVMRRGDLTTKFLLDLGTPPGIEKRKLASDRSGRKEYSHGRTDHFAGRLTENFHEKMMSLNKLKRQKRGSGPGTLEITCEESTRSTSLMGDENA